MKLLLHICCAPCSVMCIKKLGEENIDVTGYWFNPNIHPFMEYKSRLDCLIDYANQINLKVIYNDEYGLREFTKNAICNLNERCNYCYAVRLDATAKYAKQNGYDAFSTTLLYSPYQKHELLKEMGEKFAKKYGIKFYYEDFRPYYREGQEESRKLGFYMQKYCGCIFSEEERYEKKIKQQKEKIKKEMEKILKD